MLRDGSKSLESQLTERLPFSGILRSEGDFFLTGYQVTTNTTSWDALFFCLPKCWYSRYNSRIKKFSILFVYLMYKIESLNVKKYTHLLIYIFVVEKTMLISCEVYTDVFQNFSVFTCELITFDVDVWLIPMIKC